jgi:glycosyltransferase involved in cell wall biosynthesis
MKILHLLPNTATNKGGMEFSATEIISSCAKQAPEQENVVAVLDSKPGDEHNKLSHALQESSTLHRLTDAQDKNTQLKQLYAREKPDLVVFWLPETTKRIAPFLKSIEVPLVVRASTTYDMDGMSQEKKQAYRDCFSITQDKGGMVICNSEHNREWNHRYFSVPNDRQKVVVEGVDTSHSSQPATITRHSLGIPESAYIVSNVSRVMSKQSINYRKDPFGFALMAAHLSKKHPEAVFVICGEGTQWSNAFVQHIIQKANEMTGGQLTTDSFKAIGHVETVDDIYKMSDICISTAQSESFGRTVVEAMKHGVPSIVTDTGIMPEMNGQASHVIPVRPFSYADEAGYLGNTEQNMQWLHSVEQQFELLHARPAPQVEKDSAYLKERAQQEYDIARVAKQYIDIYADIVHAEGKAATLPERRSQKGAWL